MISPDLHFSTLVELADTIDEIVLIREVARVADRRSKAIHDAIKLCGWEIHIAMADRNARELEIAHGHPDSEVHDSWVWFQSDLMGSECGNARARFVTLSVAVYGHVRHARTSQIFLHYKFSYAPLHGLMESRCRESFQCAAVSSTSSNPCF